MSSLTFQPNQAAFVRELATKTGLDPNVVAAWVYEEENQQAAAGRQQVNNNDWLNIGYTDNATYGAANNVWANPVTSADATAAWMRGTWDDPGFGYASQGIRSILSSVSQGASAEIQAIQRSGWASSGEPYLGQLYSELTGGPFNVAPAPSASGFLGTSSSIANGIEQGIENSLIPGLSLSALLPIPGLTGFENKIAKWAWRAVEIGAGGILVVLGIIILARPDPTTIVQAAAAAVA